MSYVEWDYDHRYDKVDAAVLDDLIADYDDAQRDDDDYEEEDYGL